MILLESKSTNKHIFALENEDGVVVELTRVRPAKRHKKRSYIPEEQTEHLNKAEKDRVVKERQDLLDKGYKNIGAGTFEGTLYKKDWKFLIKGPDGHVTVEREHLIEILEGVCDGMVTIEGNMEFNAIWSYYYHGAEIFVSPLSM